MDFLSMTGRGRSSSPPSVVRRMASAKVDIGDTFAYVRRGARESPLPRGGNGAELSRETLAPTDPTEVLQLPLMLLCREVSFYR